MSRGLNINNANSNLISTADLGGQKILGMSGSLTNWINTGNAGTLDSFVKTNKVETEKKEPNKKNTNNIKKVLGVIISALGIAAGCALAYKNKDKIVSYFTSLKKKINFDSFKKGKTSKKVKADKKPKAKKITFNEFVEKIKSKFKKEPEVEIITPEASRTPVSNATTIIDAEVVGDSAEVKPVLLLGEGAKANKAAKRQRGRANKAQPPEVIHLGDGKSVVADKAAKVTEEATKKVSQVPSTPLLLEAPKTLPAPTTSQMLEQGSERLRAKKLVEQFMEQKNAAQPTVNPVGLEIISDKTSGLIPVQPKQVTPDATKGVSGSSGIVIPKMTDPLPDEELDSIKKLCEYDLDTAAKRVDLPDVIDDNETIQQAKFPYKVGEIYEAYDPELGDVYCKFQINSLGQLVPIINGKPVVQSRVVIGGPKIRVSEQTDSKTPRFKFADYLKRKETRAQNYRQKGEVTYARRENLKKAIKTPKEKRRWFNF